MSIPNLLDEHYSAIGARYGSSYLMVEGPGAGGHDLNVHEYLHLAINPLVRSHFKSFERKLLDHYRAIRSTEAAKTYRDPVTYVYECLVRALDKRLTGKFSGLSDDQQRRGELTTIASSGLTLALVFHSLLTEFESSNVSFDRYVPILLDKLPEHRPDR